MSVHQQQLDNAGTAATLPPVQFDYSPHQFYRLQLVALICTVLSMIAIAAVLAFYCYMLYYRPRDANRVSLRLVIGANVVSFIDHILALAVSNEEFHSTYCFAFRFLNGIFTMMPCCLLGAVGVHLFLVFVYRVHWPCRPEYILIPACVVYTGIANIIPYYGEYLPEGIEEILDPEGQLCWYFDGFADRTYNKPAWVYYYSFIFVIVVVALFTSVASMYKVYSDKMKNRRLMEEIATRGLGRSIEDEEATEGTITPSPDEEATTIRPPKVIQNTSNTFRKVVARSLLYPLMPALTYSFGFALQMYLVAPDHKANYGFAMMAIILGRLAGVFIAIIFFSDPVVQTLPREIWYKCFKKKSPPPKMRSTTPSSQNTNRNPWNDF